MADQKDIQINIMRSALGRARGLGGAKAGAHHWWVQRLTSIALVPLTLWFIWNVVAHGGAPYEAVVVWMSGPLTLVLLLALVVTTFQHMQMGLQVIIEDYVPNECKRLAVLLVMKGVTVLLALAAIVSILRVGL
jgi:succinate dehydrogenase / fumarate reductase membrane anchor subunit